MIYYNRIIIQGRVFFSFMAMESLFRTSLQGFNKQDVTNYIDELNVKYKKQMKEAQDEIRSMKKEVDKMPKLRAEIKKTDEYKAEAELLKKEIADLHAAIKAQGEDMAEKEKLLEEAFRENDMLKEEIASLKEDNLLLLRDAPSELDSRNVEEVERILDEARTEAEKVIEKANYYAKQIIDDARTKAREKEEEARRHSDEAIRRSDEAIRKSDEAVKDNLKKVKYLNRKKDELNDIFKNHKSKMDSFFSSISKTLGGDE